MRLAPPPSAAAFGRSWSKVRASSVPATASAAVWPGFRELKGLRASVDSHGFSFLLETRGMLLVAEMVLGAAALRDESRGPHLRFKSYEDNVPVARDDSRWCKYIVIRKSARGMELDVRDPEGGSAQAWKR